MTIGDLFDPKYVFYAPKTFILKLCIGLITGLVAHHIGHINETKAELTLAWNVAATSINAVTSTIASVVIYMPVRTALIRSGLFEKLK